MRCVFYRRCANVCVVNVNAELCNTGDVIPAVGLDSGEPGVKGGWSLSVDPDCYPEARDSTLWS